MKRFLALIVFYTLPCFAALNVPLTVQEALYPGSISGVARTNEPFCMGVPIADSAAIANTGVLALTGASAGQFRILGTWPDGNAKWIKVCGVVPSLSAGGVASVTLTDGGSGNFGGSNLATDNGTTITVATGAATFTIKKANFNVLDSVVVGGATVVASSSVQTRGLILTGPSPTAPFPGNVTCSPQSGGSTCATIYSSANDPNSTCVIEENGPVRSVIRCIGTHKDASGDPYMQFTWRGTIDVGKAFVRSQVILRNANYNTSATPSPDCNPNPNNGQCRGSTFDTAFKGIKSYELRISPSVGPTVNFIIAGQNYTTGSASTQTNPGTLLTGSLTAADSAYIYQGQSNWMEESDVSGNSCDIGTICANQYTTDVGYVAEKNSTMLASDTTGHVAVGGWMDCADSVTGLGIEIGVDQFSSVYPVSLECNGGGSDLRIGLLSGRDSKNVYMMWPQWKTFENFLNFHASALSSPPNDFLKYQHYLLARPSTVSYINSTNAILYPIPAATDEDALYATAKTSANPVLNGAWQTMLCWSGGITNCIPDRGVSNNEAINDGAGLGIARYRSWGDGGSLNQGEFRYGDMLKFLQRGQTGRWLNSRYFYRYMIDLTVPHADGVTASDSTVNGFTWRSRPCCAEVDGWGRPTYTNEATTNNANGFGMYVDNTPQWRDSAHDHWYGLPDYYFLTGDESVKDALVLQKDWFLNTQTYQYGIGSSNLQSTRAWGVILTGSSVYGTYLSALGDTDASAVLATGQHNFDSYVNVTGCVGGIWNGSMVYLPLGCAAPPVGSTGKDPTGVSLERGIFQMVYRGGSGWCSTATGGTESGMTGNYRFTNTFQNGILVQGLIDFRKGMGPTWSNYNRALDLAMGVSQASMTELLLDNGQSYWQDPTGTLPTWLNNGFAYSRLLDLPSQCPAATTVDSNILTYGGNKYDSAAMVNGSEGHYGIFVPQQMLLGTPPLSRIFNISAERSAGGTTAYPGDFGMQYIGEYIATASSGANTSLQDVPISNLTYLGSGVYQLGFTTPAGTCTNDPSCLRVKWAPRSIQKNISYLLNFNSLTNTFGMDPTANVPWFGANNVWPEPTPHPGSTQTFNVTTTDTTGALTAANFSVKAMFPTSTTPTGPAADLVIISGNSQSGTVGQPLSSAFVVEVTDANGNPVSGTNVTFAVTAGGGTLSSTTVSSNGLGIASSNLTLGAAAGTNTVRASSAALAGSPITFTATGVVAGPGPAASLVAVSGNAQSGTAGQPLSNPFVVMVTDSNGNPVTGSNVTFTVTAGGGTLSAATVTTNSSGSASSKLTLGASPGANTVVATSGALQGSPITFTATALASAPAAAANLVLVSGNTQNGAFGQPLSAPFVAKVTDVNGNPVSGIAVTFTVTAGGGSLSAATVATSSLGTASTTLTLGPIAGRNTVTAVSASLPGIVVTFNAMGFSPYDLNFDGVVNSLDVQIAISQVLGTVPCTNADVNHDGVCNVVDVQLVINAALAASTPVSPPSSSTAPTVTWTNPAGATLRPSFVGWNMLYMDPLSGQMLVYAGPPGAGTSIYATDQWEWNATTNVWTHITGTGSTVDSCTIDTSTLPGDRHPGSQGAIDTNRNLWWQYGGVNQICAGTGVSVSGAVVTFVLGNRFATDWAGATVEIAGTSCTSASPCTVAASPAPTTTSLTLTRSPGNIAYTSGNCPASNGCLALTDPGNQPTRLDTYYLTLNSNPASDIWTRVFPPSMATSNPANQAAAMVYDPDDDALVVVGQLSNGNVGVWKYYSTIGNGGGALTSVQVASGATRANDWIVEFNAANGASGSCTTDNSKGPQGTNFPGVVYSSATKLVYAYGGADGSDSCFFNQLWAYNPGGSTRQGIASHTWAQLCAGSCTAPPVDGGAGGAATGQPALAYDSTRQSILYHHIGSNSTAADYEYVIANDTWTLLSSTGTGPSLIDGANMTFDAVNNRLLAWAPGTNTMWIGQLH